MRRLTILLLMLGMAVATCQAAPHQQPFQRGVDYHYVVPVQPTDAKPDQVVVIEFFWYGCPHCFAFEPYLKQWLATKPDNILFKRVPSIASRAWKPQARAFYTAKALGILGKIHDAIFREIQVKHHFLRTEQDFEQLFSKYGISQQVFEKAWDSPEVDAHLKQAAILNTRYRVFNVPTIAVGGMYSTDAKLAGGFPQLIDIINFLVKKRLDQKG